MMVKNKIVGIACAIGAVAISLFALGAFSDGSPIEKADAADYSNYLESTITFGTTQRYLNGDYAMDPHGYIKDYSTVSAISASIKFSQSGCYEYDISKILTSITPFRWDCSLAALPLAPI
jgi:hypothetical protein